jgi:signal transduction histidine kinase
MQKHMRGVIDGNTTDELKLRSTDQLGDLCVTYNQLLYSLEAIEPKPMTEAPRKPAPVVTRG